VLLIATFSVVVAVQGAAISSEELVPPLQMRVRVCPYPSAHLDGPAAEDVTAPPYKSASCSRRSASRSARPRAARACSSRLASVLLAVTLVLLPGPLVLLAVPGVRLDVSPVRRRLDRTRVYMADLPQRRAQEHAAQRPGCKQTVDRAPVNATQRTTSQMPVLQRGSSARDPVEDLT